MSTPAPLVESPRLVVCQAVRKLGEARGLTETHAALDELLAAAQDWKRGLAAPKVRHPA